MITRNDPCWCGSGQKWKKCHYPNLPIASDSLAEEYFKKYGILLKTPEQIEGIRHACQIAASILKRTADLAKIGVTTNQLNDFAHQLHVEAEAIPAPLGYGSPPYPKSICTSLNEVICHGIPDDNPLIEGDIMNIDVSCKVGDYFGDCSLMMSFGHIPPEKALVMEVSRVCLEKAMHLLKPGLLICEIADVIEDYATSHHCSVVDEFVGHGIGLQLHEPPQIPHHRNQMRIPLAAGMTFTIEPMINAGVRKGVVDPNNHWTVRTRDGKPSAQWEHTFLITETGYEILTVVF